MTCFLCCGNDWLTVSHFDRRGAPLETRLCTGCGLVCNHPIPGEAELQQFYARQYRRQYKGVRMPRKRQIYRNFERTHRQIRRLAKTLGRTTDILDIGAGSGEFLFLMKALGKRVYGIEPDENYALYCRQSLGLAVDTVALVSDLFEPRRFSFIRLNHVLEHLADPLAALVMVCRWLADDGCAYIEVPDIEVYCRTKSTGRLFHFGHIYNFNPETLVATAALAGLEPLASQPRSTGLLFTKSPPPPPRIGDKAKPGKFGQCNTSRRCH